MEVPRVLVFKPMFVFELGDTQQDRLVNRDYDIFGTPSKNRATERVNDDRATAQVSKISLFPVIMFSCSKLVSASIRKLRSQKDRNNELKLRQ